MCNCEHKMSDRPNAFDLWVYRQFRRYVEPLLIPPMQAALFAVNRLADLQRRLYP